MADPNNNYVVGRGKLYFNRFATGSFVGEGFRYFGNTPELSLSLSNQALEHYSSDEGTKVKDGSVDLQSDQSGQFACDNIDENNLALFFLGDVSPETIVSAAAVAATLTGTFSGTGTAGDTITINGQAISLVASGATGFQADVGGSPASTAANVRTVINNNPSVFGVTAGGSGANVVLTAETAGLAGNSIAVSESGTGFSWAGAATALAGGTDSPSETLTDVVPGLYYQLGVDPDTQPMGVRNINVTQVLIGATPITATDNWSCDPVTGLFHVITGAPDIDDGDDVIVHYDVLGGTRNLVIGSNNTIYGELRFYAKNPTGRNKDYYWPYVKMSPNGDLNLKGDDWQRVGFQFEILKRDPLAREYIDDRA